jgi:hypothetical protein
MTGNKNRKSGEEERQQAAGSQANDRHRRQKRHARQEKKGCSCESGCIGPYERSGKTAERKKQMAAPATQDIHKCEEICARIHGSLPYHR